VAPPVFEPIASDALVVIAASAGGLDALGRVLASLPADFPAAIVVVQHRSEQCPDVLPMLLNERTALRVRHAVDGDVLAAGTVYVCPPGMHVLAEHALRLVHGPRLNHVRPSADVMLRSTAHAYGERAVGVVLSGMGSDAAIGSLSILDAGGSVIAQAPATCAHADMPNAALACGDVASVPVDEIGAVLRRLLDAAHVRGATRGDITAERRAPKTTVILADDHRITLDGLHALLRAEHDIEVVACVEDGQTAVRLTGQLAPDVVVMDIGLPDLNGIDATRRIRSGNPRTNVVALSSRDDAASALGILSAGAIGFVCKQGAFAELALAIRLGMAGRRYLSPKIAAVLSRQQAARARSAAVLTASERQVVRLTVEGRATRDIARLLRLQARCVQARLQSAMDKLAIDNLPSLTRYAIRQGIISVDD
jgi:two-component system, chemotaxis family, protein-glutamate methylesterase/glutaminase